MRARHAHVLRCPDCGSAFALRAGEATTPGAEAEILEGALTCSGCGRTFAITRGVPRILPAGLRPVAARTAEVFGAQWHRSSELTDFHRVEFESYLGPFVGEGFFAGKAILDAGCGMGKFTRIVAERGAELVVGVDLSTAADVARLNTRDLDNVLIIQADLYHLPLPPAFDFVFSIGVLHHLPDPEAGFGCLVTKHLRPGGAIYAWVYGREGCELYLRLVDPLRLRITSRLPVTVNAWIARSLAACLWVLIHLLYLPLDRLGIRRAPFHGHLLYFRRLGFHALWVTILDKLIPPISVHYCKEEVARIFARFGLSGVRILSRNGISWSGFGWKGPAREGDPQDPERAAIAAPHPPSAGAAGRPP